MAGALCAHLVGTTKTRPKALPLPARHERGEGRGEGFVYSFDAVPGASFVIRLVVPAKCARRLNGRRDQSLVSSAATIFALCRASLWRSLFGNFIRPRIMSGPELSVAFFLEM